MAATSVVGGTTQECMRLSRLGRLFCLYVQTLSKDILEIRITRCRISLKRQFASIFQALIRISLSQFQHGNAGFVCLLLNLVSMQARLDDCLDSRTNLFGPTAETVAVPKAVKLMIWRHMLWQRRILVTTSKEPLMDGHLLLPVVDLDQRAGDADFYSLADELERHGVVLVVDADMVVQADGDSLPVRILKWYRRKRLQEGDLLFLEYTAPRALALLERALIEGSKPMHYGTIQVTQGEERVVAQLRDDGRREIADCTLNRSFVARCKYARRQQRRVVMLSQLFVGDIQDGGAVL